MHTPNKVTINVAHAIVYGTERDKGWSSFFHFIDHNHPGLLNSSTKTIVISNEFERHGIRNSLAKTFNTPPKLFYCNARRSLDVRRRADAHTQIVFNACAAAKTVGQLQNAKVKGAILAPEHLKVLAELPDAEQFTVARAHEGALMYESGGVEIDPLDLTFATTAAAETASLPARKCLETVDWFHAMYRLAEFESGWVRDCNRSIPRRRVLSGGQEEGDQQQVVGEGVVQPMQDVDSSAAGISKAIASNRMASHARESIDKLLTASTAWTVHNYVDDSSAQVCSSSVTNMQTARVSLGGIEHAVQLRVDSPCSFGSELVGGEGEGGENAQLTNSLFRLDGCTCGEPLLSCSPCVHMVAFACSRKLPVERICPTWWFGESLERASKQDVTVEQVEVEEEYAEQPGGGSADVSREAIETERQTQLERPPSPLLTSVSGAVSMSHVTCHRSHVQNEMAMPSLDDVRKLPRDETLRLPIDPPRGKGRPRKRVCTLAKQQKTAQVQANGSGEGSRSSVRIPLCKLCFLRKHEGACET